MDFSGPIIQLAKSMEQLLDIKISMEFVNKFNSNYPTFKEMFDKEKYHMKYVKNILDLFPHNNPKYKSKSSERNTLSLTVWSGIINQYIIKNNIEKAPQVVKLFISNLMDKYSKEQLKILKNRCYDLGNIRNDYAHKYNVGKEEAIKMMREIRKDVNEIVSVVLNPSRT